MAHGEVAPREQRRRLCILRVVVHHLVQVLSCVHPLLALHERLRQSHTRRDIVWVGLERLLVALDPCLHGQVTLLVQAAIQLGRLHGCCCCCCCCCCLASCALQEPAAQSLPVGSRSLAASARCQAVDGQRLGRQLRTGLRPRTSRLPPLGSVHDATKTSQQTTAGLQRRSSDWPTELQMRIHRFDSSRRRQAHRVVQPLPRRLRLRRLACVASCRHTTKEPAPEGGRCITRTTYWPFLTLPAGAPTLSSESPLAPWPQP